MMGLKITHLTTVFSTLNRETELGTEYQRKLPVSDDNKTSTVAMWAEGGRQGGWVGQTPNWDCLCVL